jgi:hypothetical protein
MSPRSGAETRSLPTLAATVLPDSLSPMMAERKFRDVFSLMIVSMCVGTGA